MRGVLWFVGRPIWEDVREFLDAKKLKIDSLIFQDKCKKKTILNPATVEYQLNDSLFSSFNETSLLRWWMLYIKIAEWRNKSTQDHDSYKYAIYAVGKRKPALPFKAHRCFFSQLIFDSFVAVSLYFLANKRGSSALIWTAQISIIKIRHRYFKIISSGIKSEPLLFCGAG